ncbi:MAG: SurA N-terminal domain-containing protein [Pseudomonadota bacterium]
MLEALRGFVGSWAAKILLILLVGSFALWGVSDSFLGGTGTDVAQVGETKVGSNEFLNAYNRNLNQLQQRIGRRLTRDEARVLGVENQALGSVISFATLDEYARINAMSLSEDTLAQMIAENPAFQDSSGTFSRDAFRRALQNAQMREEDFIKLQNANAVRSQITEAVAAGSVLPEAFTQAITNYANEERRFNFLTLKPEQVGKPDTPTEGQLKEYFEANKKSYDAPEFRKLSILKLEPADIANEDAIDDAQIRADYDARINQYTQPERRRVQQIVFKSQELADAAVKSISDGATFETVLGENDVKLSDADLGLLTQNAVPEQLRDAVFSQELNTPSGVIAGPFGPTMFRVSEIIEANVTPFDEVKDTIRTELALRKANEDLTTMQDTVEDTRAGGASLADVGDRLNVKARILEAVDARGRDANGEQITDIPNSSELLRQAFQTEVGAQASPLDVGQSGLVWYDVLSIDPARERTFDEVKDRVVEDWTRAEQSKILLAAAEGYKQRVEADETLNSIALELNMLDETTPFIRRNAQIDSFQRDAVLAGYGIGSSEAALLPAEDGSSLTIIKVADQRGLDGNDVTVPTQQITIANLGAADDIINQMIVNLQQNYEVSRNPVLINRLLTSGY